MTMKFRVEQDGFGELLVPFDAVYGAQTQRAVQNFALSGRGMPPEFLRALALLKACVAQANGQLGHLGRKPAKAIERAAREIADGAFADQFGFHQGVVGLQRAAHQGDWRGFPGDWVNRAGGDDQVRGGSAGEQGAKAQKLVHSYP